MIKSILPLKLVRFMAEKATKKMFEPAAYVKYDFFLFSNCRFYHSLPHSPGVVYYRLLLRRVLCLKYFYGLDR